MRRFWTFIRMREYFLACHQWLWCSWSRGSLFAESSMSWVYGYDPEIKSFRHFPYNENLTIALNTTSLKCCLLSTDAIDRLEKTYACVWRFKVASCNRASLKSPRFSQTKNNFGYFPNRVVYLHKLLLHTGSHILFWIFFFQTLGNTFIQFINSRSPTCLCQNRSYITLT